MELKEVELKKVDDIMFKRIGVDVPMHPDSQGFSAHQIPVRALAVSNRFGYCLYAQPHGFSVAKTADLIEIAENLKDKSKARVTAQGKSVATVAGDSIRWLSLSNDELTVAVCFGETIKFYDLPTLVRKSDTSPFEVRKVGSAEDAHAKDFSWSPTDTDAYLVVTNNHKLLLGRLGFAPEVKVEKGVLAACWSEDGQHIAYASENRQLSISTSTFAKSYNLDLPVHLSDEDVESDLTVDAIRWVRPDSIMIGFISVNSEGEEDGYPLFVVTSESGNLAEEQNQTLGLVFYQLFPSIDSFVTPSGSGPYMLVDYLKSWEIVVAASRKSIDDHIILVGWLPGNGKDEAYSLELGNDLWLPRIELQENGDDNAIVGLAIDRTTVQIQLTDPKDDSGESKLPPSPVLICVTLEGKLSFFSFARIDGKRQSPDLVSAPSHIPEPRRATVPSVQVSEKAPSEVSVLTNKELDDSDRRSDAKQAVSLFNGLTKPATTLQSGPLQKPEGPKLGLISAVNQSSPFRLSEDASKSGASTMTASFPPAFSFNEINRASSLTKTSFQSPATTVLSSAFGASTQTIGLFSKGNEKVLAARPVSPQPQKTSQLPAATPSFPSISASPGKGSQAGGIAFPSGAAAFSGKVFDSGPMTRPPSTSSQVIKSSQAVDDLSQRDFTTQKVNAGLQSWPGQDRQPQGRAAGVSDMEAAFISELEKVRRMAEEVDQLMSYIEGRATTANRGNNATFTRHSLEEFEQGIHLLSEDCKAHRRQLTQEKQNVEDLRDENLRVDAWRIYARSLMDQKVDSRHQELWTLQKLHPELDMKRKRVLKADQELKLKIAEMEKHLHSLELKQWQADNARRRPNKQVRNPGHFLSVQNLYNTVNTQMAVAEELSLSLAQQMEALNIDWSSPARVGKTTMAASILKSVGAQPEDVRSIGSNGQSPVSRQRLSYSPLSKGATSADRIGAPVGQVPDLFVSMQDTTRRRRDSMDATWVESEAPKTTIKRPVHIKPGQDFASCTSSLPAFKGKGNLSDVAGSQSRRQTQRTRMATQSTNLSFSSEAAVSAPLSGRMGTSGSQRPFAQEDQQKRPSPTPLNGDFGKVHATQFTSSSLVASAESKDGLFKWASSSTSGSKFTSAQSFIPLGKQGGGATSDGPGFLLVDKTSSTSATKQSSSGSVDGSAGSVGTNLVSAPTTKPRLQGTFDGGASDTIGKSVGFVKGTILGNKIGTISSTGNQLDVSHLERDTNQNQVRRYPGGSAPLLAGPAPFLTGSKPTLTALSQQATASSSQSFESAERSVASKQDSGGRTDRGDVSQPALPQISGTNVLAQPQVSAPITQKTEAVPSAQGRESATQSLVTSGVSGKSIFDFSSKTGSGGMGSSTLAASVSSAPGFTFATAPGFSTQISGSLYPTGAATSPQSTSSAAVEKSDLKTLTPTSAPLLASAAITPAPAFGVQVTTSTSSNLFSVPSASTAFTSATASASAGGQTSSITGISSDVGKPFLISAPSAPAAIQPAGSPFTSPTIPMTAQSATSAFTIPSASAPSQTTASPFSSSTVSDFTTVGTQIISPFGQSSTWPSSGQQPLTFPSSSSVATSSSVITPAGLDNIEEDMEEEASTGADMTSLGGFGGFGLVGHGTSSTPAQTQKTNPFGGSVFGSSPAPTLSAPTGGTLFRPAAFSLPAAQSSSPQQSGGSPFGSGFGSPGFSQTNLFRSSDAGKPFGSPSQSSPGGFGQPAQLGPGQQALGSALGAFGQTRQVGFGTPSIAAPAGFGVAPTGGGFASAATGGGFASAATGGGFASAATGGGFAGLGAGGGFGSSPGGGFQGFGGAQAGQTFGGGVPQASLFTQMRK